MSMRLRVATVLVLLGLPVCLPAQERRREVIVERDLVYGKVGETELHLDLARPKEGSGPFPAIVCLHGGAWIMGKRQDLSQTIEVLAGRGYVAATVTYRLAPGAKFPAQIEDCKAAVRWLRANASKYHVDTSHVGAVGFSAGAHLACLLGATDRGDGLEGGGGNPDQPSRVQAVVSFFGPTDLTKKTWPKEADDKILVPFLGAALEDKPELYRRASPVSYVRKSCPPFLCFHGTEDKIVAYDQSKLIVEKLKAVGVSARLVTLEGEGHGWKGPTLLKTLEQMVSFFDEQLKK